MADDKRDSGAKPPLQAFYITSSYTLDVEVAPEFLENVTFGVVGKSPEGNPIIRLSARKTDRKLCVNIPPKVAGEDPSKECPDPTRGAGKMLIDQPTTNPWRIRLGRGKKPGSGE